MAQANYRLGVPLRRVLGIGVPWSKSSSVDRVKSSNMSEEGLYRAESRKRSDRLLVSTVARARPSAEGALPWRGARLPVPGRPRGAAYQLIDAFHEESDNHHGDGSQPEREVEYRSADEGDSEPCGYGQQDRKVLCLAVRSHSGLSKVKWGVCKMSWTGTAGRIIPVCGHSLSRY
ncbi:hypothetical protein GTW43_02885 [Streptomyces sp. SID5785]|uniref:hypothetical protein n=1 Tax=Streptomyces sp. SID5785 TaxID=2690309 RepID=UPI001361D94B|nr:hypothetical protein [Streptomyces sp. SID5785]MZD04031.1 hypothetical protein [Streptomyces sp. SID5785]